VYGGQRYANRSAYADDTPPTAGYVEGPKLWLPTHIGGKTHAGQRQRRPLRAHELGLKTPDTKDLAVDQSEFYYEMQRLKGGVDAPQLHPPIQWPLYSKHTTLLEWDTVQWMPVARETTQDFLHTIQHFFTSEGYTGYRNSRTVRKCTLALEDIHRMVEMGKKELCPEENAAQGKRLPEGAHERNSVKSVAKLSVAFRKRSFISRLILSILSLIFFRLHTTVLNSAHVCRFITCI
jgi:hypothetical protein